MLPSATVSVEVEKPGREGLSELAAEADVVFYSKSWAEASRKLSNSPSFIFVFSSLGRSYNVLMVWCRGVACVHTDEQTAERKAGEENRPPTLRVCLSAACLPAAKKESKGKCRRKEAKTRRQIRQAGCPGKSPCIIACMQL